MNNRDDVGARATKLLNNPNWRVNFMLAKICIQKDLPFSYALTRQEIASARLQQADCLAKKKSIQRNMEKTLTELEIIESRLIRMMDREQKQAYREDYGRLVQQVEGHQVEGRQVERRQARRQVERQQAEQQHVYEAPHGGNGFASSSKNAKGNYYDPVKDAAADRSSYQRTP